MYRLTSYPGKRGVVIHALSALDIALWDIMGKAIGLPIHKLLGGAFRKRIPAYCSLVMPFDEAGVRSVVGAARAEGWHAIKLGWFPPRSTPAHDRALVAAAREGAGADARLMLDVGPRWDLAGNDRPAVQLWDVKTAIRAIDDWAEYDPFWIEEPLPSDDVDGYRRLCEAVRPYIAAGEQEATRFPLFDLMDRGCIDIVQFDVSRVGGITEARRVVQAAQDRNRPFAPHCDSTGISLAATAHLLAASATPMYLEFTTSDSPLLKDVLTGARRRRRRGVRARASWAGNRHRRGHARRYRDVGGQTREWMDNVRREQEGGGHGPLADHRGALVRDADRQLLVLRTHDPEADLGWRRIRERGVLQREMRAAVRRARCRLCAGAHSGRMTGRAKQDGVTEYPPLPTPLQNGRIDLASLDRMLERLAPHVDGVLYGGSVSETASLTLDERVEVLEGPLPRWGETGSRSRSPTTRS